MQPTMAHDPSLSLGVGKSELLSGFAQANRLVLAAACFALLAAGFPSVSL